MPVTKTEKKPIRMRMSSQAIQVRFLRSIRPFQRAMKRAVVTTTATTMRKMDQLMTWFSKRMVWAMAWGLMVDMVPGLYSHERYLMSLQNVKREKATYGRA